MKKKILIFASLLLIMFVININTSNNEIVQNNSNNSVLINKTTQNYDKNNFDYNIIENDYQVDFNNSNQTFSDYNTTNQASNKLVVSKNNFFIISSFIGIIAVMLIISYNINLKFKKSINNKK